MENQTYKRKTREMPQEVKDKISQSLKGRAHSLERRKKISAGQKRAWSRIPKGQTFGVLWDENNEDTTSSNNGGKKANQI